MRVESPAHRHLLGSCRRRFRCDRQSAHHHIADGHTPHRQCLIWARCRRKKPSWPSQECSASLERAGQCPKPSFVCPKTSFDQAGKALERRESENPVNDNEARHTTSTPFCWAF
jgi:hypothetical protein